MSVTFVSKAAVETGVVASYNLRKRIEVIKDCRKIGKKDMKFNDSMPKMKVDPETYVSFVSISRTRHFEETEITQVVEADGMVCKAEPAQNLPLTQAYYVY